MNFESLNLNGSLLRALQQEGYTTPTPIQAQAIPLVLNGRDLLGCAQTGTGKTAAFSLPMLDLLSRKMDESGRKRQIRSLILTPTRELAIQIQESLVAYGRHLPLRSTVIFGGVGQKSQTDALNRGVDILVATPGRLMDLIGQGFINLSHLEFFVLDEADRMLDMGFVHEVKRIIKLLPAKRQSLFFSATMPPVISQLADSILSNPAKVEVTPVSSTAEKVEQQLYLVDKENKRKLLRLLLEDSTITSALVFTRTKHGADRVTKELDKAGVKAEAIHGNKAQNARQRALSNFKNGTTRVLVATDIAARGIDVDDLSHVFNYDLPNVPETYVHRIGRTGRAGASGVAISFCMFEELPYLKDIQKLTGVQIPVVDGHPFPMIETEGQQVTLPSLSNERNSNNARPSGGNGQRSGGGGYNQRSRKPRPRARQSA
jgi:ATP-dependent RNA helicase RhlE